MPTGYDTLTGQLNTVTRKRIQTSFVRPADTTAYAAGDQVADSTSAPTILTFSGAARRNGGSGRIIEAILLVDLATVTNGDFRLYIFNASFTPNNDNAAFDKLAANRAALMGWVDFDTLVADGASAVAATSRAVSAGFGGADDGLPIAFECAAGNTALYGALVAQGAYTPKSAGIISVSLVVEQD